MVADTAAIATLAAPAAIRPNNQPISSKKARQMHKHTHASARRSKTWDLRRKPNNDRGTVRHKYTWHFYLYVDFIILLYVYIDIRQRIPVECDLVNVIYKQQQQQQKKERKKHTTFDSSLYRARNCGTVSLCRGLFRAHSIRFDLMFTFYLNAHICPLTYLTIWKWFNLCANRFVFVKVCSLLPRSSLLPRISWCRIQTCWNESQFVFYKCDLALLFKWKKMRDSFGQIK